jgi:glycosyltransferase involved in cell wall biosynthesis
LNPFFSIVIPTYNRALLIQQGIHSVLEQSFSDYEIIVVDDGSTDNTESIVKEIASSRLFYFKKANNERGAARNFGMGKANGKYIVFMDSDDRMMNNHLETLYAHLNQHQEDFIATKYLFFNANGQITPKDVRNLPGGYHNFKTFLIGNPLACCFTIRKENPDLISFREELDYVIMEDWIFLVENLQFSRLYLIDHVTIGMRDHEMRSMKGSTKKIISARENALNYLIKSIRFSDEDRKFIIGSSDYFCAVHSYIGGETMKGFSYLLNSIRRTRFSLRAGLLLLKLCLQIVWIRNKRRGS